MQDSRQAGRELATSDAVRHYAAATELNGMNDLHRALPASARPEEARAFLERNADIEAVQLVITDANGIGRGKNIAARNSTPFTPGPQRCGVNPRPRRHRRDVEETGLVWSVGDADQCCRPVAGSLARASWLARPTAQVLGTMFALDGRPAHADPRHALARVVNRVEGHGLTPVSPWNSSSTAAAGD